MFTVKKYFCFELLTAGILVGWIGLAKSISGCISSTVMLAKFDDFFTEDMFPHMDIDKLHPMIISILATNIAVSLIDILTSALLIIGTIKRNRLYLLPWLINSGTTIVFSFVVSVSILLILLQDPKDFGVAIVVFIILFIIMNLYVYTWAAIYSLHNLLRRSQPNNEYTSLIEDIGATGNPIYTRA